MASKRMFDKAIVDDLKFADMPMSTKALYFLLGMEADDFGFVSARKVTSYHGGSGNDLKILVAKGFVIEFESGVLVITDWHRHNYLQKNRVKPNLHTRELGQLCLIDNTYTLN